MIIDSHCHLDFPQYDNDRDVVIRTAHDTGVGIIINVASSLASSFKSTELANSYNNIYASCGIHPHDAAAVADEDLDKIKDLATSNKKVVAIGEVGLDFYKTFSPRDVQEDTFIKFVNLASDLKLPLIIHCREADYKSRDAARAIIRILKENIGKDLHGVMHCFSGTKEVLAECLDLGLYISYTCNVTFKKADILREALKETPIDRLLLETDAPFLAPQAKRGQRNEPAYLTYLVETISQVTGVDREEIEKVTTANAKNLFQL